MADNDNTVTQVPAANVASDARKRLTGVAKLAADYEKRGAIFAVDAEDVETFGNFIGTFDESAVANWTEKAPQETFHTVALVKSETGENRLIAIADRDVAFSDPDVRATLYDAYIRHVIKTAKQAEAGEDQFTSPSGALKIDLDLDAWRFQSEEIVDWFNDRRPKGTTSKITDMMLRRAMKSSAAADQLFPALGEDFWNRALQQFSDNAEKHGYSSAIFRHWQLTRKLAAAETLTEDKLDLSTLFADAETANSAEASNVQA